MIVPFELPMEVLTYYYKICELGDISNYKERLHFICPENIAKFPKKFSLAKLLYYSPRALRQIKNIVNYRSAYLVPVIKQLTQMIDIIIFDLKTKII